MKRFALTLLVLTAAGWIWAQGPSPGRVPTGVIATHCAGRTSVSTEGVVSIMGYFPTIEGIGVNLYAAEPDPKNAHFTFRSSALRPTLAPVRGLVNLLTFAPVEGQAFYSVYFSDAPNRDFDRPDSLAEGQLIGAFQARSASVTLIPHAASTFHATLVLDANSASDFSFRGRTYNLRNLVSTLTIQSTTEPFPNYQFGKDNLTFAFGGVAVAANE